MSFESQHSEGGDGSGQTIVEKQFVLFDEDGRPFGGKSAEFSSSLGEINRAHAPIVFQTWKAKSLAIMGMKTKPPRSDGCCSSKIGIVVSISVTRIWIVNKLWQLVLFLASKESSVRIWCHSNMSPLCGKRQVKRIVRFLASSFFDMSIKTNNNMGTPFFHEFKKQASFYLKEKLKTARQSQLFLSSQTPKFERNNGSAFAPVFL
ncbi:hypothetical protein IFM89_000634 [Coptis chinensis]|uniref:Uncharacterized protein n=1 Tax=Coptis chinensis TaxID=261450 RepID=A0A835H924_9MAGN|nr:hypothetical protein IFM89_000634 [Coptis chinensis]